MREISGLIPRPGLLSAECQREDYGCCMTRMAKDRGLFPLLTGSWGFIPVLLVKETVPPRYKEDWRSMKDNKDNPSLNQDTIKNIIPKVGTGCEVALILAV